MAFLDIARSPIPSFHLTDLIRRPAGWVADWFRPAAVEDNRERRDFIRDMIDANPDAFASEYDVQQMMSHFPGHF
ncbi:hypothetical protein [Loktanella sp. IMCC34160]|uniref:hypothetical protein n=1 Tax=Loktanella sp. IMCC34160 TaxID=2510646 RepID=UPI0013ECDBE5|nr:hypothetical protein [Loktanella sp. IMCC34160]